MDRLQEGLRVVKDKLDGSNRRLLYLVVSGSHAWGLDRPDSDIDLRGVYQDPTTKLLQLNKGKDNIEFSYDDYDIQLYEIEKFLRMLCNHNGNMVNLLWLPKPIAITLHVPWAGLARQFLTQRLRYYYRGYAESQRKRAMSQRGGKALIYTYREIFSGIYTMKYGVMEHNFMKLWDEAKKQGWYTGSLLDRYFPDPTQEVTDEGWHQFYSEWGELVTKLEEETNQSSLPETFDGLDECNCILKQLRLYNLFDTGGGLNNGKEVST